MSGCPVLSASVQIGSVRSCLASFYLSLSVLTCPHPIRSVQVKPIPRIRTGPDLATVTGGSPSIWAAGTSERTVRAALVEFHERTWPHTLRCSSHLWQLWRHWQARTGSNEPPPCRGLRRTEARQHEVRHVHVQLPGEGEG